MTGKENILNALYAGKFVEAYAQALHHPKLLTSEELELVQSLYRVFGRTELISGDMGVIIQNALANIGVFDDEDASVPDLSIVPGE